MPISLFFKSVVKKKRNIYNILYLIKYQFLPILLLLLLFLFAIIIIIIIHYYSLLLLLPLIYFYSILWQRINTMKRKVRKRERKLHKLFPFYASWRCWFSRRKTSTLWELHTTAATSTCGISSNSGIYPPS